MANELRKWVKFGVVDIYQEKDGVIVKHTDGMYYVFGKKVEKGWDGKIYKVVVSDEKGLVDWTSPFNEYAGKYKGRANALKILDILENAQKGKELKIVKVDDDNIVPMCIHDNYAKHKGGVILVNMKDEVGLAHELGHWKSGHFEGDKRYTFNKETEAVEEQIKILKDKKIYNKKARDRVIESLASHSKKPYQKKRRALKAVRNIEAKLGLI